MARPRIHSRDEREIPIVGRKRLLLGQNGKHADPMLGPGVNPGGAHWCLLHKDGRPVNGVQTAAGRLECTAKRNGWEKKKLEDPRCHAPAVRGTDKCYRHGGRGMTKQTQMLKGEAQITAWNAMGRPDPNTHSDPGAIAMSLLQMSYLRVAAYSDMLRRQVQIEANEAEAARSGGGEGGASAGLRVEGLIGSKMAATNSGELYETSEAVRALVELEAQERDRAMAYAVAAHKMGISTRLTALAEQWADVVAGRVSRMLDELHLTVEQQRRVPMLVESYLGSIEVDGLGR